MSHPLPKGTIVTLVEEISDFDAQEQERITPAGSVGTITGRGNERSDGEAGWCYDLEFPSGAWITADDHELDDAGRFRIG